MAENEENNLEAGAAKSKLPMLIVGGVLLIALIAGVGVMMMKSGPQIEVEEAPAEYMVGERLYQLKDGSYLRLGFSIVVDESHLAEVSEIIENAAPGRLPSGITMILGNKTRMDLIEGTHKREAFARELKKMLEERVFGEFNKRQVSSRDMIEIREVLISDYVTQQG